jgi:hypothetical protein
VGDDPAAADRTGFVPDDDSVSEAPFDDSVLDEDGDFIEEVAFDLEGGFAEIAGLVGRGRRSRADPLAERPASRFLERLRSPLSQHEKKVVAGALLASAAGLLFLRLARR